MNTNMLLSAVYFACHVHLVIAVTKEDPRIPKLRCRTEPRQASRIGTEVRFDCLIDETMIKNNYNYKLINRLNQNLLITKNKI